VEEEVGGFGEGLDVVGPVEIELNWVISSDSSSLSTSLGVGRCWQSEAAGGIHFAGEIS
jgi:hypothetical protein